MTGSDFVDRLREVGLKTTVPTYYRWEQGTTEPPMDALPFLATAFGLKSPRMVLPLK